MAQQAKADAVIIGLGAAGGIAAYVLANAGIKVVGLEAGPYLTVEDFVPKMDEIAMSVYNWTGEPKFNKELPTWRRFSRDDTSQKPGWERVFSVPRN